MIHGESLVDGEGSEDDLFLEIYLDARGAEWRKEIPCCHPTFFL
jgi:hypothetical protein